MKNYDIVKWAKEEQRSLSKMDDNSKYVARYIECTLLPKLEEIFHTSSNNGSTPCRFFSRDKVCIGKAADGGNMYQSVPWCNHEPSQRAVP